MPPDPDSTPRLRPTRADQLAFERLQATALDRALADARVWRNGYALLASGAGATTAFIGTQLDAQTHWGWRLALTLSLGGGLVAVAVALWMTLTVEGGRRATGLNLAETVQEHNSFEMYQAAQAGSALRRLDNSKRWAVVGALLCLVGLIATLWASQPAADAERPEPPAASATTTSPSPPPETKTPSSPAAPAPSPTR